jgi:putative peptide zinc metalloprotease protein
VDLEVLRMTRIPAELTRLPSLALGFAGGGEVAVDVHESSGAIAAEPFYEVRMEVAGAAALYHGRSGRVRFRLEPEPLLRQGYRRLRQLLQRRYQL